jgi:hypothetical protein
MKQLLNEWKKYLNEQDDAEDQREEGPGMTGQEESEADMRERYEMFRDNLTPEVYREIMQTVSKESKFVSPKHEKKVLGLLRKALATIIKVQFPAISFIRKLDNHMFKELGHQPYDHPDVVIQRAMKEYYPEKEESFEDDDGYK